VANKEQAKVSQPKIDTKVTQEKNSQPVAEKQKKSQPQAALPKKRRFTFFNDVVGELRKAVWPTRQETLRLTLIVLGICIAMGIFLGAIDFGFSELVAKVLLGGK
jgi:preprotein translocase subunit SecE